MSEGNLEDRGFLCPAPALSHFPLEALIGDCLEESPERKHTGNMVVRQRGRSEPPFVPECRLQISGLPGPCAPHGFKKTVFQRCYNVAQATYINLIYPEILSKK